MQRLVERFGPIDRVIETQISQIFLFNEFAVKQYKHQDVFFGNLADGAFRKGFYEEDFFWNHDVAPDIYLELAEIDNDFFIIMKRIEGEETLTRLLESGTATSSDMQKLTTMLVEKLRHLSRVRREKLASIFDEGWRKLHEEGLEDLRQFMLDAPSMNSSEANAIIDLLRVRSANEIYFDDSSNLSVAIDTNCDNLLFLSGKPTCIDVLPVKEDWRVVDEYYTILRSAVDAEVLGNAELGDIVRHSYSKIGYSAPRIVTLIYELRAALIQWAYRLYLGQFDRAKKYQEFAEKRVAQLK